MKDFKALKHKQITLYDTEDTKRFEQLTRRSKEVPCDDETLRYQNAKELHEIIASLRAVIERDGLASLSAPALGYDARVFALDWEGEIKAYINPFLSDGDGITLSREVCSSLPGREYLIPRRKAVTLYYQTPTGQIKTEGFRGVAACVVQHELDHLDGVLLEDLGLEIDEDFDNASPEEQDEVVNWYLKNLELQSQELQEEIKNDDTLSHIDNAFKFVEAVARGDVTLEQHDEMVLKDIEDGRNPTEENQ